MLIQPCKREMITDVKDNHAYQPGNVISLKIIAKGNRKYNVINLRGFSYFWMSL